MSVPDTGDGGEPPTATRLRRGMWPDHTVLERSRAGGATKINNTMWAADIRAERLLITARGQVFRDGRARLGA